jgi:hypothetical protein
MSHQFLTYCPLVVSFLAGFSLLWTEIMRGKNGRLQSRLVDQTTIEGKHIDDSIQWRKDLLDENKSLRTDLAMANKLISDLNIGHMGQVREALDRIGDTVDRLDMCIHRFTKNNEN